jgi:hypothetical protein
MERLRGSGVIDNQFMIEKFAGSPTGFWVCLSNRIKAISRFQIPEEGSQGTLAGGMKIELIRGQ